jgi:hypothetical protein
MMVHIHGFDWISYSKIVMPAFASWLLQEDMQEVHKLYLATRSAQEDQHVPEAMRSLCAWPRALEFVKLLPRGPFARSEYQKLCTAEQFLLLSDHYVYRHPPQLFRESEALRTIWGACVEHYCLPWYQQFQQGLTPPASFFSTSSTNEVTMARNELFDLLETAGLSELAQELIELAPTHPQPPREVTIEQAADQEEESEDEEGDAPKGIFIGRLPTTLHLRGWLATQSLHAMVLFEYLVCGRRTLPFGSQEGDPFGSYVGYLIPDEVQHLHSCLRHTQPPNADEAKLDYAYFRQQRDKSTTSTRLIDEILPAHAQEFFNAVHNAATERLGLICTIG